LHFAEAAQNRLFCREAVSAAAILGCAGLALDAEERAFFRDSDPLGFILFSRNIESPDQVRRLIDDLRGCVRRSDAFVLIDQEGGRVARLPAPPWQTSPAAGKIGALYCLDPAAGLEAARLNAGLIAGALGALGIDVDCAPVLDLHLPDAHAIIGNRSFGAHGDDVAALGRAACEGFLNGGVLPVIKHIPGHGRATQDSHKALPIVDTPREILERTDFVPFRALRDMPVAMTAHVVYTAIDRHAAATVSRIVLGDIVRGAIGFDGLLIGDDLSMAALQGGIGARAAAAIVAGCDVVLHCNGVLDEMAAVIDACGSLSPRAVGRIAAARAKLTAPDASLDPARLEGLLMRVAA
jgi:beta-N-acetylhexosaminidase